MSDSFEKFEFGDSSKKSVVELTEYDRKTVLFGLSLVHDHLADLVDENGWRHKLTCVDDRTLTFDQLLAHVRTARRLVEKPE